MQLQQKKERRRKGCLHEKSNAVDHEPLTDLLYKKIDLVTEGLNRYLRKQLKAQVSVENSAHHIRLCSNPKDRAELIREL